MLGRLLPSIGAEIPCSCSALQVPLEIDILGTFKLDFRGGLKVRVEASLGSGRGVKLKIVACQMSTVSAELGRVILTRADIDMTPLSVLELIGSSPPVYRQTLFLDFHVMIERPPNGGRPLVLSSTRTARLLHDHLTAFPPQNAVHQLQEPVDLAPLSVPRQEVARLLRFPVTISGYPSPGESPFPLAGRRGWG